MSPCVAILLAYVTDNSAVYIKKKKNVNVTKAHETDCEIIEQNIFSSRKNLITIMNHTVKTIKNTP